LKRSASRGRSGGSVEDAPRTTPRQVFASSGIDNIGKVDFMAETETSQSATDQLNLLHFQTDQSKRAFDRAALRND